MVPLVLSALNALTDPIGLLWAALLAGTLVGLWKRQWALFAFALTLLAVLQLLAGTNLSRLLIGQLEGPYDPRRRPAPSPADAVVMLGGTLDYGPREALRVNVGEPADRILTAVELVRSGRAPVLVLSSAPYLLNGELRGDSELIAAWLQRWGLPRGELLRLPLCRNTRDEALAAATLATERGWKRIVLVTSAYHLRRAEATFRHVGLTNLEPVGCDFLGPDPGPGRLEWTGIPRTGPLVVLNYWTHEQVGWWYYRMRGWR